MAANIKQDMPPPGGYSRIFYERTFPKTWVNWKRLAGLTAAVQIYCWCTHKYHSKRRLHVVVEENDVKVALEPFLLAERDRLWLETLRKLRDEENEVMKNVPGWKTGTWYGEPTYFTISPDKWWDPTEHEIYAQSRWRDKFFHHWFNRFEMNSAPHFYDKWLPDWLLEWQKY